MTLLDIYLTFIWPIIDFSWYFIDVILIWLDVFSILPFVLWKYFFVWKFIKNLHIPQRKKLSLKICNKKPPMTILFSLSLIALFLLIFSGYQKIDKRKYVWIIGKLQVKLPKVKSMYSKGSFQKEKPFTTILQKKEIRNEDSSNLC